MATPTKTQIPSLPLIDLPGTDQVVAQIQSFNERLLESTKTAGLTGLDAYAQVVASLVEIEERVAASSKVDFFTTALNTHVTFVKDVSGAYVSAAREALK